MVAAIAGLMFFVKAFRTPETEYWWLAAGAAILCIGMMARFLKFYASFAGEVARAYAFSSAES